jgi:predicted PurR-regulated permease PerM
MSPGTDLVLRTVLVVVTVLVVSGLAWFLVQIKEILFVTLIAAILAAGVAPLVSRLEAIRWTRSGWRVPRTWAIALTFLAIIVGVLVVGAVVLTPLVYESQQFIANFPERISQLQTFLQDLRARYTWIPDFSGLVQRLPQELTNVSQYFAPAAGVAFKFLGGIATFTTILFMAFYMLVQGSNLREGFLALFPRRDRAKVADVIDQIGAKFGGWVRGQLLLGLIIGIAAGVGMAAIQMPYPYLLGIIAGLMEFVPMLGPTLGSIPAIFLALFQPPWKLIFTIVWYLIIQQTEGNFIVPRVMRSAVGLSPLLTILALFIGGTLVGIGGALLAIPVAAALQVIVGEIARRFRPAD